MAEIEKVKPVTEEEWKEVNQWNREITQEFLQQGHLSPHTLTQYESAIKIFFRWVKENCSNKPLYELKPRDALRYQNYLINRELSSNAIKFKRSAVSSLCGYVELYFSDEHPLFRNIYNKKIPNPPKQLRREKKPLTIEELDSLIRELEKRNEWQMIAYIQFSYDSGCRRSESLQILKEIVNYEYVKDPRTGEYKNYYLTHNVRTKGRGREGKIRRLMFSDIARSAVLKWLEVRGEDDCPYVFVRKTKDGQVHQLSVSTFNDWCSGLFTEIVGRRVHPHQLRSSRATNAVVYEGKSIDGMAALLGHNSTETTKIYVVKDNDDEVDDLF